MILSLVFFVCYVSDKVVSFSDSIPTICVTLLNANFSTGYILLIYSKETLWQRASKWTH